MVTIRPANLEDAEIIVKILREGLGEVLLNCTIAGAFGIKDYVKELIVNQQVGATKYYVGSVNGKVVGFAEFRLLNNELFLNNIYVAPKGRGTGTGTALLKAGLDYGIKKDLATIKLDVFEENILARRWYEKIGFKVDSEFVWVEKEIFSEVSNAESCKVLNLPFANCVYNKFGFATIEIETTMGLYHVGILCESYFRINSCDLLTDKEALACLKYLGPSKKILYIDTVTNFVDINSRTNAKVAGSFRMSSNIRTVMACLK